MLGRWEVALLALCFFGVGCSERLTASRAGTIIRHSKAFLSGAPEGQPVFGKVTGLLAGIGGRTPERREADSYIAEFSYHWREGSRTEGMNRSFEELNSMVVLRRSGGSWAVDDDGSRALVPSWPQLPKTQNPFLPGASRAP